MRIVCLSDTHTYGRRLVVPDGDVLIHAGDHTFLGTKEETKQALKWLASLPHQHKLLIAGNHDFYFDDDAPEYFRSWKTYKPYTKQNMLERHGIGLTYLEDSGAEIDGVTFYGSPWSPAYYDWAFNFKEAWKGGLAQAEQEWANIPTDVNVLITHTPPQGILDAAADGRKTGCYLLRRRVQQLPQLRLHVFGHIHESYGREDYKEVPYDGSGERQLTFVNASICNLEYDPDNLRQPIVVDL